MAIVIENSQSTNKTLSDFIAVHNFLIPSENEEGDPIQNCAVFVIVHGRGPVLSVNNVIFGESQLTLVEGITYNGIGSWIYYLSDPEFITADIVIQMSAVCDSLGARVYLISGANLLDLIEQVKTGMGTGIIASDRFKLTIGNWILGGITTFEPVNNFAKLSSLIDLDVARVVDSINNNAVMYAAGNLVSPSSANQDISWDFSTSVNYTFVILDVNYGS